MTDTIHIFEKAGLGKAPFYFKGCTTLDRGGSCDFCVTAIKTACWIVSSDGKRFKVGSNCVRKTGDAGLRKKLSEAEKIIRQQKKAAKTQKEKLIIESAQAQLETVRSILSTKPHPNVNCKHLTYADYVDYLFFMAGHTGRLKAAKIILNEVQS